MGHEQLHEKAKEIAQALGWDYAPPAHYHGEELLRWATLVNPEGGEIHLSIVWNQKDRLHIGGHSPTGVYHPNRKTSITVFWNKSSEVIAKDITRRLLPIYLPIYKEAAENKRRADEQESADRAIVDKLAAILGENAKEKEIHFYRINGQTEGSGTIKVREGEVSLDLRWVKPEIAEAICKVLVAPICDNYGT